MAFLSLLFVVCVPPCPAKPDKLDNVLLEERHDVVELNHFYSDAGDLTFSQYIWYDWKWNDRLQTYRFDVIAWRLVQKDKEKSFLTTFSKGYHCTRFVDGEAFRNIQSRSFRETWTQYDPEQEERQYLMPNERQELLKKWNWVVQPQPQELGEQ